jgi:hypothetical protein
MADRRHAVLYAHSRHLSGVFLRSSDPLGKTVSRWPKQSGYFSWVSFISFWLPDDWDSILNGNSSQTLLVLQIIFSIHPGDVTFIRKTEVTVIPYDEMFMNRYADDLARKNELACNGDVFL